MAANFTPLAVQDAAHTPLPTVSTPTKETEPFAPQTSEQPIIGEVAVEHELHPDVKPYIQARQETPRIDADLQQVGVQAHAAPAFVAHDEIKLPITDEEVVEGLQQPVTSSFRWLAEMCKYLLSQAHLHLKTIHGKVIRVGEK